MSTKDPVVAKEKPLLVSAILVANKAGIDNRLKQNGVAEETRCQFIGHEHHTVNSRNYSEHHSVEFLMEQVASKLDFSLPFERIPYPREAIVKETKRKMELKQRLQQHEKRQQRGTWDANSVFPHANSNKQPSS